MWRRIALLLYTYYKIYYLRFYSRVIASWTSTTTDLIACGGTSGHVHETIDDLSKTSRNTHLSSVSRFWRNAQLVVLRATCEFEEVCCGVLWSFPVLKHSKKEERGRKKISAPGKRDNIKESDEYFGWSLTWCRKIYGDFRFICRHPLQKIAKKTGIFYPGKLWILFATYYII